MSRAAAPPGKRGGPQDHGPVGASGGDARAGAHGGDAPGPDRGRDARATIEQEALARLAPSPEELRHMAEATRRLLAQAQAALDAAGLPGEATLQGSVAKGTWLAGSMDVDVFLLLDPGLDEQRLHDAARRVGAAVLDEPMERYAQHPYMVGRFQGLSADIVPAYRVAHATHRMSAVDRTPFHTAWAAANLDEAARQQVRLIKAWCKGVGVYGADTARAGFSGYLLEVLAVALGDFGKFVAWLAGDAMPRRLSLGEDHVEEPAPLVVVDPVDPTRNCAAAVAQGTLAQAVAAARAYVQRPDMRFFFPAPPREEPAQMLRAHLQARRLDWLGLWMPGAAQRLDIVFPQFQKALHRIGQALLAEGFQVVAQEAWTDDADVGLGWLVHADPLPAARLHTGPPADSPHADRFTRKWQSHPDAVSAVRVEAGRMQVEVANPHRTAEAWLAAHLHGLPLGKHVEAALADAQLVTDPAHVVSSWSPAVADFILDRRPWQR